jgi:cytochrome c-type biogenesis protein CcmH/NrfF
LAAGPILEIEGWKIVNLAMLPLSVLISGVIVWWVASERRRQRHDRKIAKAAAM